MACPTGRSSEKPKKHLPPYFLIPVPTPKKTKKIKGGEEETLEERLKELSMCCLAKQRIKGMITVQNTFKRGHIILRERHWG